MSRLVLEALRHGELAPLSASFDAGPHVVLGNEVDGTNTLLMLVGGSLASAGGRITLDGVDPRSSPAARRRIATLYAKETLPPSRSVQASLELALRARKDARSGIAVLDAAGLAPLAARPLAGLSTREARAVALCLALSHRDATLVALFEPLGLVGLLREDFILQALRRFADVSAVVLCSASRFEDAERLGGSLRLLDRGIWLDPERPTGPLPYVTLRVRTPEPRRLAARLSEAPDIDAVEWFGGQELVLRGADPARLCGSVVANARAEAIRITAMKQDAPTLQMLAAARAATPLTRPA